MPTELDPAIPPIGEPIPITIIATPGAADANSYVTLAEGTEYLTNRRLYSSAFFTKTAAEQSTAFVMATRLIDDNFAPYGNRTFVNQALKFPRTGLLDEDGNELDSNTIPFRVKEATCELALALCVRDRTAQSPLLGLGLTAIKVGPIGLSLSQALSGSEIDLLPSSVLSKLAGLGDLIGDGGDDGQIGFARVVRT